MITDTSKKQNPEWLFGMNPNAIEAQESKGQKELVQSSQLPAIVNSPYGISAADKYKELGITVVEKASVDTLFLDVILPDGWAIKPTEHTMWSHLVNDKGEEVASIFYKAAFYDRDAFINFI